MEASGVSMNASVSIDRRSVRAERLRKTRKELILKAAQRVISTKGYNLTSIDDVIEEAKISRGTFYLYFKGRDELFYELVDGFVAKLMNSVERVKPEAGSPLQDLQANVRRVVDVLLANRDLAVILLRESTSSDRRVADKIQQFHRFVQMMISGALATGAKWKITRKVNESIVAMAIIGSLKEILHHYLVLGKGSLPTPDTLARDLWDFGFNGLRLET